MEMEVREYDSARMVRDVRREDGLEVVDVIRSDVEVEGGRLCCIWYRGQIAIECTEIGTK
jgi:hypothetical protein